MSLTDIFPDGDHRFEMRLERGTFAEFFGATSEHQRLTEERRHWLRTSPQLYAALLPEGEPLLKETRDLAGITESPEPSTALGQETAPFESCLQLGECWEPDYLLLRADSRGAIRLWGGCVCFPSSWRLSEKLGHPIEVIHDVVPGLNQRIGAQIHTFLAKLKPGETFQRSNWGLSRSSELNQHPDRCLLRLDASVSLDQVWLRVEHQALVALPLNGGVLFGIRVAMHSLRAVKENLNASRRLVRALSTMPEDVAQYKGLTTARSTIIQLLQT